MFQVVNCITGQHSPWLLLLALLTCAGGSWVTMRLYLRADITRGLQRAGWVFLAGVAGGAAVWSTHFVALLAFESAAKPHFEPLLTMLSLLVAIAGMSTGFGLSLGWRYPIAPEVGGVIVGLSAGAMHYIGIEAYRFDGLILWDSNFVIASLVLAAIFGGLSLSRAMRPITRWCKYGAAASLTLAILSLHFTGMAAVTVIPLAFEDVAPPYESATAAMALIIAGVSLLVVGSGLASWMIDNSTRADSVDAMRRLALTDGLTQLPNRLALSERLDVELERAAANGHSVAVVAVDLEAFKELNETKGHRAGDEVLRALARRLESCLDAGEFVARVGGDDFCAVKRYGREAELIDFTSRIEEAIRARLETSRFQGTFNVSMGVSIAPTDTSSKEQLLGNAELALQRAKSEPAQIICFYEGGMDDVQRARRKLASDLRNALDAGQFELHYQPQVDTTDGNLLGFEALLRWRHPERGMVSPAEFVPIAEERGLIVDIGDWVLLTACRSAAGWNGPWRVAVNLSPLQLADDRLPERVHLALLETGLSPSRLELEITESTIMRDPARALHLLRRIKGFGVSIAMDDFGTGHSSLSTLRQFPFDKIKLDRSFISDMEQCAQSKAVIRAVLALGGSLGIAILAEGVETQDQLDFLREEGCGAVQGYFTGKPVPQESLIFDVPETAEAPRRVAQR
ncbi:MAG: bifunctional diguanylate cyclase/phosphodiesterase [Pseudomonadota bacterium]|nr:bifunctional diguanylate cyclase/phosphodiesterase [Pseudomonadota bacterium]